MLLSVKIVLLTLIRKVGPVIRVVRKPSYGTKLEKSQTLIIVFHFPDETKLQDILMLKH